MQPKILLVDDRADNLMSLQAILEPENYRCIKANSGREALKILLQEVDFALILMDVKMPNLNGYETASLIYEREKLKNIPIIFITAHNYGEEHIFRGYKTGAVDYIYKPINPDLLKAKVSVFIELYKKNQKLQLQEQKLIAINKNLENEINERKISEEKVRALNLELLRNIDRLEATNKDLDRFAFMASHDLQEPLRKIHMFSDRLYADYLNALDDRGQMYINRIRNSAERMQVLIKDILTFSKISVEKPAFVKSNINELITNVVEQLDEVAKAKDLKLVMDPLPELPVNPTLIQVVFYNIISNALKYSKTEVPPVITIHSESRMNGENSKETEGYRYCRIYIEDNGIGFDQKYAEQIFSMFTRLHNNNEYEGTGIGLALCKKIVEDHKGFISARSKVNVGSTFIISLPYDANEIPSEKHKLSLQAQ